MIVWMDNDISRSLTVDDDDLLMMGYRVPRPERNPDLLGFYRCHCPDYS